MIDIPTVPITVVMPTIGESRAQMYERAAASIQNQTVWPAGGLVVALDTDREGAAATRNRALAEVTTPWVAFLDDDDEFMPDHLEILYSYAVCFGLDVVYSGCEVVTPDGILPHGQHHDDWGRFGKPFSAETLRQRSCIPVTCLARTDLAQVAQFGAPPGSIYDDWGFYLRMLDPPVNAQTGLQVARPARFEHIPVRTWIWHHHGANTSGQPDRW